jgi:segregation and condensation protein B
MIIMEQKKLIEAALFMASKPLDLNSLSKITGIGSLGLLKEMVEELQNDYGERGIEIIHNPEGWSMHVRPGLLDRVAHLAPHSDLPNGCKRTLALIAYKEPAKQSDLIKIQGNKAYSYINYLKRKGLVKAEKKGHTKILKLTKEFERYFGEEKEKVKEQLAAVNEDMNKLIEAKTKKKPKPPEPELTDDDLHI